jgi:hypothetical protein
MILALHKKKINVFMRRIIGFFALLILFTACGQKKTPDGIIEKSEMANVLFDMHITDAYLNQVQNNDTMLMEAHTRYNYIFKKHQIDSAKFTNSLTYYSKNPKELDELFTIVTDSITKLEDSLRFAAEVYVAPESKFDYLFKKYETDSPKFKPNIENHIKKDSTSLKDTTIKAKDSLTTKPIRDVKPGFRKFKRQNDISTK